MFQDILRESWVYQEIGQEYLEKGVKQELQRERQMLTSFVERHFPELTALAKQQVDSITDPDMLQGVFLKLLDAQTVDEAKKFLFDVNKSDEKH